MVIIASLILSAGQIFPLDINSVLNFIKTTIRDWRSVASALNLSYDVIEEISANNPQNVRACMRTMISKWMNNSTATPPSWWLLAKALKSIEQNGIVRKIRSSHGKSKDGSTNCRPSRFIHASNSFTHI